MTHCVSAYSDREGNMAEKVDTRYIDSGGQRSDNGILIPARVLEWAQMSKNKWPAPTPPVEDEE